jgi:uncharacterized membrane protein YccC
MAAVLICGLLGLHSASRLSGVTVTIILLAAHTSNYLQLALSRFFEVNVGIVIALLTSLLLWPHSGSAPETKPGKQRSAGRRAN